MASPRRGLLLIAILTGMAALAGAMVDSGQAAAANLLSRLAPMHGLKCAAAIVVLSLPILGMLSIFMRNGASAHAKASSVAVGLTGACWNAFVFAFYCPANDLLYVLTWYAVGSAVVVLAARSILPKYAAL